MENNYVRTEMIKATLIITIFFSLIRFVFPETETQCLAPSALLFSHDDKLISDLLEALKADLNEEKTQGILQKLREMSPQQIAQLYDQCLKQDLISSPLPDVKNNSTRRINRHREYVAHLQRSVAALDVHSDSRVIDLGCGDGQIFVDLFRGKNCQLLGCDVVTYLTPEAAATIHFTERSVIDFIGNTPDNSFDVLMENVMLHHLPSTDAYRFVVGRMIKALRPGGRIIITETIHKKGDYHEWIRNAILDIYLNDLTSFDKQGKRIIPVPVQFLSEEELEEIVLSQNAVILEKIEMKKTVNDPKRHITYVIGKKKDSAVEPPDEDIPLSA
jgi:2-polyprenyl-3-methyl-5-hydroxy-6-metoxy-1,4-benzoquinol methylase